MESNNNEVCFVTGGTPQSAGSNRMAQLATELDKCDNHDLIFDKLNIAMMFAFEGDGLHMLERLFGELQSLDIHIVGSRNYVYRSEKMKLLVNLALNGDLNVWKYLPRTLGLRDAVQVYCEKVAEV